MLRFLKVLMVAGILILVSSCQPPESDNSKAGRSPSSDVDQVPSTRDGLPHQRDAQHSEQTSDKTTLEHQKKVESSQSTGNQDTKSAADAFRKLRVNMVEHDLKLRDISNKDVLRALSEVPRHEFVPKDLQEFAYSDQALPIGHDQTISQPYIVGLMTQLAKVEPGDRVLDVGTGSGYQAAVLGELAKQVYSIEILQPLADEAQQRLKRLGYRNIEVRSGDGYAGWPDHAPFDAIIVAAAPNHVPPKLVEQLAAGARLVIPVGDRGYQELMVIEKQDDGSEKRWNVTPVAFVPMTGEAQNKQDR